VLFFFWKLYIPPEEVPILSTTYHIILTLSVHTYKHNFSQIDSKKFNVITICRYRRWGTRASRRAPVAWVPGDQPHYSRRRPRRVPRRPRLPRPRVRWCLRQVVERPLVHAGVPGNTCSSRISKRPTSSPQTCCTRTGNKDRRHHPNRRAPRRQQVIRPPVQLVCGRVTMYARITQYVELF